MRFPLVGGLAGALKTKVLRQGQRPTIRTVSRTEWWLDRGIWVHREMRFDTEADMYTETLTDPDTGEELCRKTEKLSEKR